MSLDRYPKFCTNCGAKLTSRYTYCHLCGNRIISKPTPPKKDVFEESFGYMPEKTKNLFRKALGLFTDKKVEKSLIYIDKAIELNPDFSDLWLFKGRVFGSLTKFKKALEYYDKALSLKPNDLEIMIGRVVTLRFAGKWEEALNFCNDVLKIHPNDPKVLENRSSLLKAPKIEKELLVKTDDHELLVKRAGYLMSILKNSNLALEFIDKALELNPESVFTWTFKASAHMKLNESDKALFSFEKGLEITKDDPGLWGGKGIILLGQKKLEESINCFDKALKLNPGDDLFQKAREKAILELEQQKKKIEIPTMADIADNMKILVDRVKDEIEDSYEGGDPYSSLDSFSKFRKKMLLDYSNSEKAKKSIEVPEEYIKFAETIKSLSVQNPTVRKDLLSKLKVEDFSDEIIQFSQTKPDLNNSASTLLMRGTAYMYQGQYMEALKILDEALRLNPNMAEIWKNKGNILVEMNRELEGIKCYDMAINLNLGIAGVYSMKGRALNRLNKFDDALINLEMALALNPNLGFAWMNKGNAMQSSLNFKKRFLCYNKALEVNPALPSAWHNKGKFLLDFDIDLQQAIDCFDRSLQLHPKNHHALENKAVAIAKMGKNEEALLLFDEVLASYPNSLYSLVNKGNALTKLKRYDEALKYHDRALKINPTFKIAIDSKKQTLLESRGIEPPINRNFETNIDDLLQEGSPAFQNYTKTFFKFMDLQDLVLKIEDGNRQSRLFRKLNELFGPIKGVSLHEKVEFLEELGSKAPGVNLIWKLLEDIYTELNDFNNQIRVIERLIDIDPTDDLNWNRLGVNLCIQGKFQEGIKKYQEVLNLNPNNYNALSNLSLCYEILGDKEKAIEILTSLLNMNPKESKAQQRLNNLNDNSSEIFKRVGSLNKDSLKTLFQKEDT